MFLPPLQLIAGKGRLKVGPADFKQTPGERCAINGHFCTKCRNICGSHCPVLAYDHTAADHELHVGHNGEAAVGEHPELKQPDSAVIPVGIRGKP